jgi:hypothetical protein
MTYFWLAVSAVAAGLILAWWAYGVLVPLMCIAGVAC